MNNKFCEVSKEGRRGGRLYLISPPSSSLPPLPVAGGPERRRRTLTSRWQPYNLDKFKRVAGYRGAGNVT